jgi:putative phosphoribosyl transferase
MLFDNLRNKFQLKLRDRITAACILSDALKYIVKKDEERKNSIVLGIPRGGVIIADTIARKLPCEFGIIMTRKLRAPHNEEVAIGAVMEDGTTYLNEVITKELGISHEYIEKEKTLQLEDIKRRISLYYGSTVSKDYDINKDKTVILADDGAATGATVIAATRWIRATKKPAKLIVAIPVAPKDTMDLLRREAVDHIEVITAPSTSHFRSVGQYYQSFEPVSDKEVIQIIQNNSKHLL